MGLKTLDGIDNFSSDLGRRQDGERHKESTQMTSGFSLKQELSFSGGQNQWQKARSREIFKGAILLSSHGHNLSNILVLSLGLYLGPTSCLPSPATPNPF